MSNTEAFVEPANRGMITVSIMLATIIQVIDTTIANVALPSMQGSLGAAQDTISWVLTSYIVAAAIMTPATGWLAGRFGRKEVYLVSVAGFTISSMLCGTAQSLTQMVLYRLMQGVFGAALVPLSQTVLLDINPREKHGQAMAMWGAGIMVGPIVGPTLGGWLTDAMSWRWVFFINVPLGLLAFMGILTFMPKVERRTRRFDFFGFAMLSLFIGALQMMLDRGQQLEWFASREVIIEFGLAITGFWVFLVHMFTAEQPFVEPKLFTDRNFVTGCVFIFIIGVMLLATMALLPPLLQQLFGYPIVTVGLVLMPRGVGTMISMLLVGRLIRLVDARLLIVIGLLLTAASLFEMGRFSLEMGMSPVIMSGLLQGLGLGLVFVPMSTIAFATLRADLRTEGSALFSLVRNIGSSIGISVVMTLLSQNTQVNHSVLGTHINLYSQPTNSLAGMFGLSVTDPKFLSIADQLVNQQALMISYLDDFRLMMFVALAAAPLLLFLKPPKAVQAPSASAAAADAH